MKFAVITFPGSNCEQDIVHVLKNVMNQEVIEVWHKDEQINDLDISDCIVLPGGFSYGDYLRAGAIARFSPVMRSVIDFAEKGGKVFGVCNGFQVLCETGLLPGALLRNKKQKFICKTLYLKTPDNSSALTSGLETGKPLRIPVAHAEGRYYADKAIINELIRNEQVLFRYCSAEGELNEESNPNGSVDNIAGICNSKRNVFGMMPHPERASEDALGNRDGKEIFESLISSVN